MSDHSLYCSATDKQHSGPYPTVTVKNGVLGKWLSKGDVVVISWKVRVEAVSGIPLEGLENTQPWASGWAAGPREKTGDDIL